jgi:hypothetical protein
VLAVSRALYGAGDVLYWVQSVIEHHDVFPSGSDALYLTEFGRAVSLAYPAMDVLALGILLRLAIVTAESSRTGE